MDKKAFPSLDDKKITYERVLEKYNDSLRELQDQITQLQLSANEETKSSVGDKYETGRAMIQLEIEKLQVRLGDLKTENSKILSAAPTQPHSAISQGSLVTTSFGIFYIIYNAGIIDLSGSKVNCISCQSPLGKALLGKQANESVIVNTRKFEILSVV